MNKRGKQSGFTLIEIIVVLIILGVLAAIALPAIFSNIEKSKSAEALMTLKTYKDATIACLISKSSFDPSCLQIPLTSHGTPYSASTANFQFSDALQPTYISYTAWSKADITNFITVTVQGNPDASNPVAVFDCEGVYKGLC